MRGRKEDWRERFKDPLEVGPERKGRTSRLLITELGIKLWGWI